MKSSPNGNAGQRKSLVREGNTLNEENGSTCLGDPTVFSHDCEYLVILVCFAYVCLLLRCFKGMGFVC